MGNDLEIYGLECEHAENPLGIDALRPRFSWKLRSGARGTLQTAYRVIVSSTPELLARGVGDKLDSGRVESDRQTDVEYAGSTLRSGELCHWHATVWDNRGGEARAAGATFEMGLLRETDWKGSFIGFPTWEQVTAWYFRRDFNLEKAPARARAYICVPGYFELYVNGRKIGDHALDPGTTDYSKTLLYVTHDITPALVRGANALTVLVGNGWYKKPRFLLQCNMAMEDGTEQSFCSENSGEWFGAMSPISYNDIYGGEHYDSRFEVPGWNLPGNAAKDALNDRLWDFAARNLPPPDADPEAYDIKECFKSRYRPLILPSPGGKLRAQAQEPIKAVADVRPVAVAEPEPGVYVFDMGENMAGWAAIRVRGEKGSVVELKFAEITYDNGLCNRESLRLTNESHPVVAHDRYVLRGEGEETFEPRFTYHGFRYVQVEGLQFKPGLDTLTGRKVRSSVAVTGSFRCSDELLNRIQENILRTEACNMHSIPTDCPQRDERHGWLNDVTARSQEAVYNYGMNRFYEKWLHDISDGQDPGTGAICDTAPFRRGLQPADPMCSSYLIAGWLSYVYYGNLGVIRDNYEGFAKWARYIEMNSIDGIVNFAYWSDWCQPIKHCWYNGCISKVTPGEMISTAFCYHNFDMLSKMAHALGKAGDEAEFTDAKSRIREAFNGRFYDPAAKRYAGGQAGNAAALYTGLAPEEDRAAIASAIAEDMAENDGHFTTGNLCTVHAAVEASALGGIDAVYRCMTATDYPSFGYQIGLGATTIWERWEHLTGKSMNSHNHPMFGSAGAWFYKSLAGILPDELHPAFRRFNIEPKIPSELEFAEAELNTVRGKIRSAWKKTGRGVEYTVTIPAGSTAALRMAATGEGCRLTENGQEVAEGSPGILGVRRCGNKIIVDLGSGDYTFVLE